MSRNDAKAKQSLSLEKQATLYTLSKSIQEISKSRETKKRVIDELANRLGNRKKAKDVVKNKNYKVVDDDHSDTEIDKDDKKHLLTE